MDASRTGSRPDAAATVVIIPAALGSAFLLAIASALVIKDEITDNGGRVQWWHVAPAVVLAVPYLVMAWQALRGTTYAAAVFAFAQGAVGLAVAIPASLLAMLGAGLSMGDRDDGRLMFSVLAFTALQVMLAVAGRRTRRALAAAQSPEADHTLVALAPVAWLAAGAFAIGAASAMTDQARTRLRDDGLRAQSAVLTATACLIESRRRTGEFPESLAGVVAAGCMTEDVATRHKLSYLRDGSGFVLATAPVAQLNREDWSYLGDESGRVLAIRDRTDDYGRARVSAGLDQRDHEPKSMLEVVRCLVNYAETEPAGVFPERLDEMTRCHAGVRLQGVGTTLDGERYRLDYRPLLDAGGQRRAFELEVRPKQYGRDAIRSYRADDSQIVRGTGENRAATIDDPEALDCEVRVGDNLCDRGDGEVAARLTRARR